MSTSQSIKNPNVSTLGAVNNGDEHERKSTGIEMS